MVKYGNTFHCHRVILLLSLMQHLVESLVVYRTAKKGRKKLVFFSTGGMRGVN